MRKEPFLQEGFRVYSGDTCILGSNRSFSENWMSSSSIWRCQETRRHLESWALLASPVLNEQEEENGAPARAEFLLSQGVHVDRYTGN